MDRKFGLRSIVDWSQAAIIEQWRLTENTHGRTLRTVCQRSEWKSENNFIRITFSIPKWYDSSAHESI